MVQGGAMTRRRAWVWLLLISVVPILMVLARPVVYAAPRAEATPRATGTPEPPGGKVQARPRPLQSRFAVEVETPPQVRGTPLPVWLPPAYPQPWAPTPHDHFLFGRVFPPPYEDIPIPEYRFAARASTPGRVHGGIDIPAPAGVPILAIGSGRVIWAGEGFMFGREHSGDPYGLAVVIRHDLGWDGHVLFSLYAHMRAIWVQPGQWVAQGTPLGQVGSTGMSDGPHVHLEIRVQMADEPAQQASLSNPELWIAPPVGWGVLVGRVYNAQQNPWDNATITIQPLDWTPEVRTLWQGHHHIITHTYTRRGGILSDPYYRENFALNNLPAGRYRLIIGTAESEYRQTIMIYPGRVTFFIFTPTKGIRVVKLK